MIYYTYCFVRKDMKPVYHIIQAAHAMHEIGLDQERIPDAQNHMILFEVADQKELLMAHCAVTKAGVKSHLFYEPDYDTGFTSFATVAIPQEAEIRTAFRDFKLYGSELSES